MQDTNELHPLDHEHKTFLTFLESLVKDNYIILSNYNIDVLKDIIKEGTLNNARRAQALIKCCNSNNKLN